MKIVRAIRQGRIVPNKPKTNVPQEYYSLWATPSSSQPPPLPAPKPRLPTTSESYNPPAEYLPTDEERKQWEETDKEDRERDYLPRKHAALRLVPAYDQFIRERFSRLLDLYMAPRIQRVKLSIDPQSLIPKLPSPQSLKPFPVYRAVKHTQHRDSRVKCISASPGGEWVVSGDENGIVCVTECATGHEAARWKFEGKIGAVAWCPRQDVSYFVVGVYGLICPSMHFSNVLAGMITFTSLFPLIRLRLSSRLPRSCWILPHPRLRRHHPTHHHHSNGPLLPEALRPPRLTLRC